MKKSLRHPQSRFYLYLTTAQADQVSRLQEAGLSVSTIGRQAIRKCCDIPLVAEDDTPRPERCNLYLTNDDVATLEKVATRENCSKAMALRRLASTYLFINASAIDSLF
ncbi:hypothetical protein [Oryzomonas rubra]|uniref:Ribbon-helix-helix protein, copG family n=1 Tax=Oryzomonas rubra TaxID=2509454 RepID=A0A5A9XQN0_9BACT|nr:hypothetical protein [Oryzomonas rubra]KAA0895457.1 hypothetical protein ET418_02755 [Oryzomonas rubra]